MRRDWVLVIAAYGNRPRCELHQQDPGHICEGAVQFCHVTPRDLDRHDAVDGVVKVNPLDIFPMCGGYHDRYDGRNPDRLDLIPYLDPERAARAVQRVGLVRAVERISGQTAAVVSVSTLT